MESINVKDVAIQTDPISLATIKYHTDPEYRKKLLQSTQQYIKERKKIDPEFKEKILASHKKSAQKYYENPENAEKKRAYNRERYQRLKAEKLAKGINSLSLKTT